MRCSTCFNRPSPTIVGAGLILNVARSRQIAAPEAVKRVDSRNSN